jgi:hypothetical protein
VTVVDQFNQMKLFDVRKPLRLCSPAEKRVGDEVTEIENPRDHLMCYAVKRAKDEPKHKKVRDIHTNNQFGPLQLDTEKEEELCLPSTILAGTNTPPVADAGPDRSAFVAEEVKLDGSGSTDVDGDKLTFFWSILSRPQQSIAELDEPARVDPIFVPDVRGRYVVELVVNDGTEDSAPDTVTVEVGNRPPEANAGSDRSVRVGQEVILDGNASFDPDGDSLTFSWSFDQRPPGSLATLIEPASANPSFVPDVAGGYVARLIVNDGELDSAPDLVTITANPPPPSAIALTPATAQIDTRDSLTLTITLDQPALAGGQIVDLVASNTIVTVPATATVAEGQTTATFVAESGLDTGNVTVTASATSLASDSSTIQVKLREFSLDSPLVGIGRTVTARIDLARAAAEGGATFNLSVADPNVATVSPATLTIPQGQTTGTFELTGGSNIGATSVTADGSANGYETQTLDITVTDRLIDLPTSRVLAFGETTALQVLISPDPAPAGGVEITVESSNPAVVQVLTPTVTIPEGGFSTTAMIQASTTQAGDVVVTASNPGFAPDITRVTVSRGLDILETTESFEPAETELTYIQINSGGAPFPAPPGGVSVTLTSDNTDCVNVVSPITIPEGSVFAATTLSYGGVAPVPCSAIVTAENAIFGTDTVAVTVEQVAEIGTLSVTTFASSKRIGSGLQTQARVSLSTGNHGGITVQIESSNPNLLRLAPNATTPGGPIIELLILNGSTQADFFTQGVRGATGDDITVTASSAQFTDGTVDVDVIAPVLRVIGLNPNKNTLAADDPFFVDFWNTRPDTGGIQQQQAVSAEGPLAVTLTSSMPTVGALTTLTETAVGEVTVTAAVNTFSTPTTVAAGGVAFDALSGGTTTVRATAPGFDATRAESSVVVTVSP